MFPFECFQAAPISINLIYLLVGNAFDAFDAWTLWNNSSYDHLKFILEGLRTISNCVGKRLLLRASYQQASRSSIQMPAYLRAPAVSINKRDPLSYISKPLWPALWNSKFEFQNLKVKFKLAKCRKASKSRQTVDDNHGQWLWRMA